MGDEVDGLSDYMRIGAAGTEFGPDEAAAAAEFAAARALRLDGALEPKFLAVLLRLLESGSFVSDQSEPGHREVEAPQRAGRALNLALSRPEVLRWLERVSGCGPLDRVEGRVAQTLARPGDELTWHDDLSEDGWRRLAVVVNLGTVAYEGGGFELRRKTGEMLLALRHTEAGSALVFAVDRRLEHRVLPVTAGGPRRVFAGWAYAREGGA